MPRIIALTAGVAAATWLGLSSLGAASPRLPEGTKVFKGSMDPAGSIRFQALESKRGKVPRLDRFLLKFDCNDGLEPTGAGYGAAPGSSIRPDEQGRFRIRGKGPKFTFALDGDFNRRYTSATGTFRFQGDTGDAVHVACDTGKLHWRAELQP